MATDGLTNEQLKQPPQSRLEQFMHQLGRRFVRTRRLVAHAVLLPDLSGDAGADLRVHIRQDGALSSGYVLMCAISAGIATLGLLQSSTAVVIGAMLVSPLMSPIASLGFAFSSFDGKWIRDAARVVLVGAAIGVLTGALITLLSPIRDATPEIIARTRPTLLDLAVALLSGIAGGYAAVQQKGGTAIGVAIATALMPPLATIGYGVAVLEPSFTGGAMLLFLTNLAAIAFSFALIARLSGAARPRRNVEWTPRYIAIVVGGILALAVPLATTLMNVVAEARTRAMARESISSVVGVDRNRVAQLDITVPIFGETRIDAVVITPKYRANIEKAVTADIERRLGSKTIVNLQQILAADLPSQTRAMVDAAMERTAAGIAADVPPYARIRSAIGLPMQAAWANRAERLVTIVPAAAPNWTLADFRQAEELANEAAGEWSVHLIPPPAYELRVALGAEPLATAGVAPPVAIWAMQRWGVSRIRLSAPKADAPEGGDANPADSGPIQPDPATQFRQALTKAHIAVIDLPEPARAAPRDQALVQLDLPPPSLR